MSSNTIVSIQCLRILGIISLLLLSPAASGSNRSDCLNYIKYLRPYYEKLFSFYKSPASLPSHDSFLMLKSISAKDCKENRSIQSHLDVFLSRHSGKIGVLLPLSGPKHDLGKHFAAAIKSYYKKDTQRFQETIIMADTKGLPRTFHEQLAKMVFEEKVSIIIGGATKKEAKLLRLWSSKLQTTTLILNGKQTNQKTNPHAFYVSPDSHQMSFTLTNYMRTRGFKKIALFYPEMRQNRLVDQIRHYTKKMGIEILNSYAYKDNDYPSIEGAVKNLFKIDDIEREEELTELIEQKKQEMTDAGLPFSPKGVFLPPIVDIDAIIIADHFKALRHIVGVLKFFKVPRIPLLGTQQWRAEELLTPAEPYLSGSVFVDYVGNYQKLPYRLKVSQSEAKYFTSPTEAQALDIWLVARHGIDTADRVIEFLPKDRRLVYKVLEKIPNQKGRRFFQSKQVFDDNHITFWPTYLFTISGNSLYQLFQRPAESMQLIATPF